MRTQILTFLAMICIGFVALSATAQPGPRHDGPSPGGRPPGASPMELALEDVDLPAEVREEIDALLDASHRTRRIVHRSLRKAHDAMRALLESAQPDEDAILGQAEKIGELRTSLEKDRLVTLLRIRERLSPDQREVLTKALGSRDRRPGDRGRRHRR
jgi:Spy/CpxP family protein refolding chaperone